MPWKYTPMSDQSQFDILIRKPIDDWGFDDDILMQPWSPSPLLMNHIRIVLSMPRRPPCWLLIHFIEMYSAPELNISNDKKWLAQLGHCMGVLVPKMWAQAAAAGRRTNRPKSLPPAYSAPRTMSRPRLTGFQTSVRARLLSFPPLSSSSSDFGGFVDFEWAATVGGREVNVWRPNAARRSNLGFSSPGEWAKPHFNKLGFPVINPWMKGSDQAGCVGPPSTNLLYSDGSQSHSWPMTNSTDSHWLWIFCSLIIFPPLPQYDRQPAWQVLWGLSRQVSPLHKVVPLPHL